MNRLRLPIGVQDFQGLRGRGCYYVDKTPLIRQLVDRGSHYFLSRPRRFGKSLLVDTLRELFSGNEPLFRGLHIHGHWDWSEAHPVVHLSFGGKYNEPGDLASNVRAQMLVIERRAGLENAPRDMPGPDRLWTAAGSPSCNDEPASRRTCGRVRQADPRCARQSGIGTIEPRLPSRVLWSHQGQCASRSVRLCHRGQYVLEGEPVFWPEQLEGH